MSQKLCDISIPCFNCPYGHSCAYYSNVLWIHWILENRVCPAFTYPFDVIYYETLAYEKRRKEEEQKHRKFDDFPSVKRGR